MLHISFCTRAICAMVVTASLLSPASADVFNLAPGLTSLQTVHIGNPHNLIASGKKRGTGAIPYHYDIGTFEITAAQYTDFLNAVAKIDTYELYNPSMAESDDDSTGCQILRTGSGTVLDPYFYSVAPDWANRPVNFVSWGDAARFANWLHNGQPTGPQNASTTERGSYTLDGLTTGSYWEFGSINGPQFHPGLDAVTRNTGATWVLPNSTEWYKAAYHKNDGPTANYFLYPTSSDTFPSNGLLDPDPGNSANSSGPFIIGDGDSPTIGPPYYRTEVGDFENSPSPYATFDQAGNIFEWNESGDAQFRYISVGLDFEMGGVPHAEGDHIGFRVAFVPEPASVSLLALATVALLLRRKIPRFVLCG